MTALHITEEELEPPAEWEEAFDQAQRLLARLLVRAWLEEHKEHKEVDK